MPFMEAARVALASLRANKLRSFLTVLGILIGVSSVVAVVAITEGLDRYIAQQVLELGTNTFYLQKFPDVITSREQWLAAQKRPDLTMADLHAVQEACTACAEVGGMHSTSRELKFGRTRHTARVMGITANVQQLGSPRDIPVGRPLIEDDVERARPVAVIGTDVAAAFFGQTEPVGKEILLGGVHRVEVVGVAEKKGSVFGQSQDNFVWIPITHFRKLYGTRLSVVIQADARSPEQYDLAQDQARVVLRGRHHLGFNAPDDFNVETGESVMELWQSATSGIYVTTIVVTGISLIVGGVVVMNIMLVSVTERIKEIGIRKALGARRTDILRQFLVESVVLSVAGGALGVLGATLGSKALAFVLGQIMSVEFTAPVQLWAVALALAVSGSVGLVAGVYPASRAARLDPVEALRTE
jgi:putative ABC transport system permease protein